jgi:hypothetical protein
MTWYSHDGAIAVISFLAQARRSRLAAVSRAAEQIAQTTD